jgi:hypothetical protein
MLARRIAVAIAFGSTLLYAEDFSLRQNGLGPITVHTTMTFEGQGERLFAVAVNDSGQSFSYVKLCVVAGVEACLFELENAEPWQPGKTVSWNLATLRRVPNLSHQVKIMALAARKPEPVTPIPEVPTTEVSTALALSPPPAAELTTNADTSSR